jgi:predicted nucleotidyltransferase
MSVTLLSGVVGSTAYGLAGPNSDVDRLGIYAAPTIQFHGLHPPGPKTSTIVQHDPDVTMHEAGKFAGLCLNGNPTLIELLWLEDYEVASDLGEELISIRDSFLSARGVRDSYYGYAVAQFKRLEETGEFKSKQRARSAKHARHMLRLLDQGWELYTTGKLTIQLENPQWYIETGDMIAANTELALPILAGKKEQFETARSVLPEHPDEATVERWLQRVRARFYPNLL